MLDKPENFGTTEDLRKVGDPDENTDDKSKTGCCGLKNVFSNLFFIEENHELNK